MPKKRSFRVRDEILSMESWIRRTRVFDSSGITQVRSLSGLDRSLLISVCEKGPNLADDVWPS